MALKAALRRNPNSFVAHFLLGRVYSKERAAVKANGCTRAVLVGHNPSFDLGFVNAAVERTGYKRNPFHPFSTFDTATLGGLAYGQTVLSRAIEAAGIAWDGRDAHSAICDAEKTSELFCAIVNRWTELTRNRTGSDPI